MLNQTCYLLFYIIRHQENRFKHVKVSHKKIKGWGMELFYSLLYKQM